MVSKVRSGLPKMVGQCQRIDQGKARHLGLKWGYTPTTATQKTE
jgi:hypothetical protein